jgi:hypothetical protein
MLKVEIRVKGRISEHWSEWFDELEISHTPADETTLKGEVKDQSALYGLLAKLRDLGLSLVAVNFSES